jgi:sugar phosphate isomerase/epimerase
MVSHAVHDWSLHRTLGRFVSVHANPPGASGGMSPTEPDPGALALLDLPRELAARGYDTVQLCHFHLPSRDRSYLDELRSALSDAGVVLDALLVDSGDLVDLTDAQIHERWIAGWLEDAAVLGARRARVIAGQSEPTPHTLAQSSRALRRLAQASDVRVVTENWMALLPTATQVHEVLDACEGEVGLLVDLANWTGPDRDAQLASIGGRAETSHAKCRTTADGELDVEDYRRALHAVLGAGFSGPLCLVYDGPDPDEWAALAACRDVVDEVTVGMV